MSISGFFRGAVVAPMALFTASCTQEQPSFTLEQACPALTTVKTTTVPSNYSYDAEADSAFTIYGTIGENESITNNTNDQQLSAITQLTAIGGIENAYKPDVFMFVASSGGGAVAGLTLADAIEHYGRRHIIGVCQGSASSAASFILSATGTTYGYQSCNIITHGSASGLFDESWNLDSDEMAKIKEQYAPEFLKSHRDNIEQLNSLISGLYERTLENADKGCVAYLVRRDIEVSLNGDQALKLGFLDAVFKPGGMIEVREKDAELFSAPLIVRAEAEPTADAPEPSPQ